MALEVEAKLAAPSAVALARLPDLAQSCGFLVGEVERHIVHDHYLDTADLDLYRAGWALRIRDSGVRQRLTMKALTPPRAGIAAREERETLIEWTAQDGWELPTAALDGEPTRMAAGKPFQRLFSLQQERSIFPLAGDEGTHEEGFWCEASMDLVRWTSAGGEPREAYEAEFELKQGSEDQLRSCVAQILQVSGWKAATSSKFQRGLEAAGLA